MPFRVGQERGRKGWYVYVDRPKTHHLRRGGKTVRRKASDSREEALRNALRIEAELVQQWAADEPLNPFQAALRASRELGVRLDVALDWELRDQGYKPEERDRLSIAFSQARRNGSCFSHLLSNGSAALTRSKPLSQSHPFYIRWSGRPLMLGFFMTLVTNGGSNQQ